MCSIRRRGRVSRAAARIQHPHVAGVLYQGEERDTCFYVMELVTGDSLAEYVVREGTLDPATAEVARNTRPIPAGDCGLGVEPPARTATLGLKTGNES